MLTKINDFYSFDFSDDFIMNNELQRNIEYHNVLTYIYNQPEARVPSITFQVTDACNLACSYCYQINKGTHKMSFETAKKFIDLLLDNNEQTKQYIDTQNTLGVTFDFIGGEPFLEIELIEKIINYFEEQCILKNHPWQYHRRYSFSSNGTLYFKPEVQAFIKKHVNDISLSISIDGNKELHDSCRIFPDGSGSYDIAMAAVKHYREIYGQPMGSKLTIAPQNVQYIAKAVIHMIENGYHTINLNCVYEKGWQTSHATTLYYQLKEIANYIIANNLVEYVTLSMFNYNSYCPLPEEDNTNYCGGNGKMLAVDWKGDMYPCLRYMESSLGANIKPVIIGNVNEGFMPNAQCINCVKQLQTINRLNQSTEECIKCPVASGCGWCQAYNYQDSGNFYHRATYICEMHQATSLANSYYWNLYLFDKKMNSTVKIYLPEEKILKIIPQEEYNLLKALEDPDNRKW